MARRTRALPALASPCSRRRAPPYDKVVLSVNFGGEPQEPVEILSDGTKQPGPRNRRAEMWKRSRDWLHAPGGADIPDQDSLQADACAPGYSYDMNQRLVLESKERMRARGVRSPDEWDAVALTFAEPVKEPRKRSIETERPRTYPDSTGEPHAWMAI
jgi:hypothetical protein